MLLKLDLSDLRCPDALIRGKRAVDALRSNAEATHLAIKTIEPSLKRDLLYYFTHTGNETFVHDKKRPITEIEAQDWIKNGALEQELEGLLVQELVIKKLNVG